MPIGKLFTPTKAGEVAERLRQRIPDWQIEVEAFSPYRARLTAQREVESVTVLQTGYTLFVHLNNALVRQIAAPASVEDIADAVVALTKGKNSRGHADKSDLQVLVDASDGRLKTDEGDLYFSGGDVLVYGCALADGSVRLGLKASPEIVAKVISAIFHEIAT